MLSDGTATSGTSAYGDPSSPTTVVLFGDSHAAQWFPALSLVATARHLRLVVQTKKGCPTADIRIARTHLDAECVRWRAQVVARLATEHPALVVMSSYRYHAGGSGVGLDPDQAWANGLDATLTRVRPTSDRVLVLGDTPTPLQDVPGCASGHVRALHACDAPRASAVKPGRVAVERRVAAAHRADFVPSSDWLCSPTACPVVIGDVLMYRDDNHLSATGSAFLAPYLDAVVGSELATGTRLDG
jgi:hypothetical protein